uniref:SJCHGC04621 protein n=1 Tax=Schistosoma japonicum TaxID=6182 RepID=Q5DFR1_SCHJA|nr:SJCHGC04621 protein [Schistosoma japonicum]
MFSSDTMINILVNKPTIMMNAKLELLSLWNWFCSLTIFELKFISQFITCEYKGKNDDLQPVGLCDREKLSISSPDGIPVNQRNPLLLHRLKNIITYLPRPLTVNVVMHPLLEQIIQKMHLSTELCKLLDEFSLNKHG